VIRITWRRLPVIAGENAATILSFSIRLSRNGSRSRWNSPSGQANRGFRVGGNTVSRNRVWLFNARNSSGLVATNRRRRNRERGDASDRIVHQDPGLEPCVHQGWLRSVRRVTSAAVAGDQDAIAKIEARIGPDKIGMGPLCVREVERSVPTYLFADRMLMRALARLTTHFVDW